MNMDETPFDDRDIYWKKDSYFKECTKTLIKFEKQFKNILKP